MIKLWEIPFSEAELLDGSVCSTEGCSPSVSGWRINSSIPLLVGSFPSSLLVFSPDSIWSALRFSFCGVSLFSFCISVFSSVFPNSEFSIFGVSSVWGISICGCSLFSAPSFSAGASVPSTSGSVATFSSVFPAPNSSPNEDSSCSGCGFPSLISSVFGVLSSFAGFGFSLISSPLVEFSKPPSPLLSSIENIEKELQILIKLKVNFM